jgi:hypothetical protein
MSLLTTDIRKVKRLSLREVRLPERREPITPIQVERPPTEEEIAYSRLVAINPLIEELVGRLDLVSPTTAERINKVTLPDEYSTPPENVPQGVDSLKLITFAKTIIEGERGYTREEIVERIIKATNVSQDRADIGFTLLLQYGAIEQTINPYIYHLKDSTPF